MKNGHKNADCTVGSGLCRRWRSGSSGVGRMRDLAQMPVRTTHTSRHLWAVVLAGGDGIRLRDLTVRIVGDHRPKQFCRIIGAETLLTQTRARLNPLFSGDRQVFVVNCAHERYYSKELTDAKDSLVIAQAMDRGTGVGIIVALVQVIQADPDAIVGFFPSDHFYSNDELFRSIVRLATLSAEQFPQSLVIVGAEAEYAKTEYGWIEPGLTVLHSGAKPLCGVNRFLEKPALPEAQALLQKGCLWNTFVTIGSAATFLELICCEVPDVVLSITRALADQDLTATYVRLAKIDFSRDTLAHRANRFLVLRDSGSGWADLGSPDRVLGLLANNVNQRAGFVKHRAFYHVFARSERSCDGHGNHRPRRFSHRPAAYRQDGEMSTRRGSSCS